MIMAKNLLRIFSGLIRGDICHKRAARRNRILNSHPNGEREDFSILPSTQQCRSLRDIPDAIPPERCTGLKELAMASSCGRGATCNSSRWRSWQGMNLHRRRLAMISSSADGGQGRSSKDLKIVSGVFFPDGEVIRRGEEMDERKELDMSGPVVIADAAPKLPEVWGRVHSIESFSAVDGPGIRSVVFLQGCMRRCLYCANPDTWSPLEKCLRLSSKDIAARLRKNLPYYSGGGGVTLSGGEPLLQPDFCAAIFKEAHAMGISTVIDTAGYGSSEQWAKVLPHTDVVMLCVKAIDPHTYLRLVGMPQREMLTFARHVGLHRVSLVIRYVLVPGLTDTEAEIQGLIDFAKQQPSLEGVEILPYHTLGKNKWEELGIRYRLEGVPTPSKEVVESIRARLEDAGLRVLV